MVRSGEWGGPRVRSWPVGAGRTRTRRTARTFVAPGRKTYWDHARLAYVSGPWALDVTRSRSLGVRPWPVGAKRRSSHAQQTIDLKTILT